MDEPSDCRTAHKSEATGDECNDRALDEDDAKRYRGDARLNLDLVQWWEKDLERIEADLATTESILADLEEQSDAVGGEGVLTPADAA